MATSSITANFYCDDAKAANAFVRMLVSPVKAKEHAGDACRSHAFRSLREKTAFFSRLKRNIDRRMELPAK